MENNSDLLLYEKLYYKQRWNQIIKQGQPESEPALYFQALANLELQNYSTALEMLWQLKERHSQFDNLDYHLGVAYYYLQDYEQSKYYLKTYIEAFPQDSKGYLFLSYVLFKQSKFQIEKWVEIIEICEKTALWTPELVLYKQWAIALYNNRDITDAHAKCYKAIEQNPLDHDNWLLMGKILRKAGYLLQAYRAVQTAQNYSRGNEEIKEVAQELRNVISNQPFLVNQRPSYEINRVLLPEVYVRNDPRTCDMMNCEIL